MSDSWRESIDRGVRLYLAQFSTLDQEHTKDTPSRVVRAFDEYSSGMHEDPGKCLEVKFDSGWHDSMIHLEDIWLTSMCSHHLLPIIGRAHFAYIPKEHIVGLSKIPRFIRILAKRPQIQETLTDQIVDVFFAMVNPAGCAVSIRAFHCCMAVRGVEERSAIMKTTALRGCFKDNAATRQEFMSALKASPIIQI
jgi:GTP cyclohydrolase I